MTDNLTKEQRRKNMQAIKSQSKLEDKITREIWKKGIRFRRNVKSLPGKPDIAIKKYKIVIFIDSCFWHKCPIHGNMPKTNNDFWRKKLNRNCDRDKEITRYYIENNWNILRLWEHSFKSDFNKTINIIISFINSSKG